MDKGVPVRALGSLFVSFVSVAQLRMGECLQGGDHTETAPSEVCGATIGGLPLQFHIFDVQRRFVRSQFPV